MIEPISTTSGAVAAPASLAGLSAQKLHESLWSLDRLQVVRRGAWDSIDPEARAYLLLKPDEYAVFEFDRHLRARLRRARTLELDLRCADVNEYRERLVLDEHRDFKSITRDFDAVAADRHRVVLTADAAEARRWTSGLGEPDARGNAVCLGEVMTEQAGEHHAVSALLCRLLGRGVAPASMRRVAPEVLAHQSSTVSSSARIIGPVVIGAGHRVGPNDTIEGPAVILDRVPVPGSALSRAPGAPLFSTEQARMTGERRRRFDRACTRAFDIAFSIFMLAVTLPVFPVVMALIAIEDGRPFFFLHERQGHRGKNFKVIKFRTMRRDADAQQAKHRAANLCDGPQFFSPRDPRALRTGHFLRQWSIDELPQFINVIRGEMSVVGPRPSPDRENRYCPAWRELRLSVKPGVTGLWQIMRTREPAIDFQEWVRYDTEYVRRRNVLFDLWIVGKTFGAVIRSAHRAARVTRRLETKQAWETKDQGVLARIEDGRVVRASTSSEETTQKAA